MAHEVVAQKGEILRFEGEKVAFVSAELPLKERWTELTLYLTDDGSWLLHGVGKTRVKGETDRHWVVLTQDPAEWLDSVIGNDASRLAKKLLAESFEYLQSCD